MKDALTRIATLTLLALLLAGPALADITGNPDERPSITLWAGSSEADGDWSSTAPDTGLQQLDSKSTSVGLTVRVPVSPLITLSASASKSSYTGHSYENTWWYGSSTTTTGWSISGGLTIYLGSAK